MLVEGCLMRRVTFKRFACKPISGPTPIDHGRDILSRLLEAKLIRAFVRLVPYNMFLRTHILPRIVTEAAILPFSLPGDRMVCQVPGAQEPFFKARC